MNKAEEINKKEKKNIITFQHFKREEKKKIFFFTIHTLTRELNDESINLNSYKKKIKTKKLLFVTLILNSQLQNFAMYMKKITCRVMDQKCYESQVNI